MSSISSTSTFASFDELESPGGNNNINTTSTRLSCAPLAALAREMESTTYNNTSPIEHLLETLASADRQIEAEQSRLRAALRDAEIRAATAEREAHGLTKEVASLKELIAARQGATDAQLALVKQLKEDNAALRDSYAAAVRRAGDCDALVKLSKNPRHSSSITTINSADDTNNNRLPPAGGNGNNTTYTCTVGGTKDRRISVTVGGNRKDMRFSDAELAYMFQENERLEVAGLQLIRQVEVQKDAHGKLKHTVSELMVQLEQQVRDKREREARLKAVEKSGEKYKQLAAVEEDKAANIQRQHNKLLAEYEMLEIAHKHSIAENNKLKLYTNNSNNIPSKSYSHHTPGKQKTTRNIGVLGSVENLLHNRRNNNNNGR